MKHSGSPSMIKLLRLLARVRYWRSRALRAETKLIEVSADAERRVLDVTQQADAERWRNVYREDMMTAAANFGSRGMVGIQPRNGPAEIPQPRPLLTEAPDPWNAVSPIEKMEFQTQWVPLGVERGLTIQQMQRDFLRELASRKQFNDEPSM